MSDANELALAATGPAATGICTEVASETIRHRTSLSSRTLCLATSCSMMRVRYFGGWGVIHHARLLSGSNDTAHRRRSASSRERPGPRRGNCYRSPDVPRGSELTSPSRRRLTAPILVLTGICALVYFPGRPDPLDSRAARARNGALAELEQHAARAHLLGESRGPVHRARRVPAVRRRTASAHRARVASDSGSRRAPPLSPRAPRICSSGA